MELEEYADIVRMSAEGVTEADDKSIKGICSKIQKSLSKKLSGAKIRGVIDTGRGVVFKLRHQKSKTRLDYMVEMITPEPVETKPPNKKAPEDKTTGASDEVDDKSKD